MRWTLRNDDAQAKRLVCDAHSTHVALLLNNGALELQSLQHKAEPALLPAASDVTFMSLKRSHPSLLQNQ